MAKQLSAARLIVAPGIQGAAKLSVRGLFRLHTDEANHIMRRFV